MSLFSHQSGSLFSQGSLSLNPGSAYAFVNDGDDLVPDERGALTPSQMVDAKLYALVGEDLNCHREETACTSLKDRRQLRDIEA